MKIIRIEVVFALPAVQRVVSLEMSAGTTLAHAVERSGLLQEFAAEIDSSAMSVGVFGKIEKQPQERVLEDGDRVEIYRPLAIDPKDARRARAQKQKGGHAPDAFP